MNSLELRHKIISKVQEVPEESLPSIKDYVDFISEKNRKRNTSHSLKKNSKVKKRKNTLTNMVGIAEVEPFADKIDDLLYGRNS